MNMRFVAGSDIEFDPSLQKSCRLQPKSGSSSPPAAALIQRVDVEPSHRPCSAAVSRTRHAPTKPIGLGCSAGLGAVSCEVGSFNVGGGQMRRLKLALGLLGTVLLLTSCHPPLTFGSTVSDTISPAGDSHTFSFTAMLSDRVLVRMVEEPGASANFQPSFEVRNSAGVNDPRGAVDGDDTFFEAETGPLVAGQHTIVATDNNNDGTGSYKLHVQRLNNPGMATGMAFGSTLSGSLAQRADSDAFTFTAALSDQVIVRMVEDPGSAALEPQVRIYGPAGVLACPAVSVEDFLQITCGPLAAGQHTILATDDGGDDTGSYKLHLQRLKNPGMATAIADNQTLSGSLSLPAESDAFTFTAALNDTAQVTMTETSAALEPELLFFDSAGEPFPLCFHTGGDGATFVELTCGPLAAGQHTILAIDREGDDTGTYNLNLQLN
jgi:hypothetical protein